MLFEGQRSAGSEDPGGPGDPGGAEKSGKVVEDWEAGNVSGRCPEGMEMGWQASEN